MAAWKFDYSYCSLGVQHLWWATMIINLITLICGGTLAILQSADSVRQRRKAEAINDQLREAAAEKKEL